MSSIFTLEAFQTGGVIMYVLLFASVTALAIIIERFSYLRSSRVIPINKLREIELSLRQADLKAALETARSDESPMMRVAEVALINADKPSDDLKTAIEETGRLEMPRLERYLTVLYTIAVASPLLGLLGTVTGMIHVFEAIVTEGSGNTGLLAGGISEAMVTTAFGLTVAIPSLVFYNFLAKKVDLLAVEMERHSLILFEMLSHNLSDL